MGGEKYGKSEAGDRPDNQKKRAQIFTPQNDLFQGMCDDTQQSGIRIQLTTE